MRKKFDWEIKTLEEIATDIYRGAGVREEQLGTGDFPAIKCGDINSKLPLQFHKCISFINPDLVKNKKYFEHGDVLIANTLSNKLETVGRVVVYLGTEKCLSGEATTVIKHNQNPKYLAYAISSEFTLNQIKNQYKAGTVFNFLLKGIKDLKIPLPPLAEQERIVSILDKFHTICGDIEEGIPKLIEECEKQYEYYRDQIFNLN